VKDKIMFSRFRVRRIALVALAVTTLSACFNTRHASFEGALPAFELTQYFDGCVVGWGVIDNWRGEPVSRFKVYIDGSTDAQGVLTLDEQFVYDDASRSTRVWRVQETSPNQYRGTAADVEGEASGEVIGNTLRWKYRLRVPRGDSDIVLAVDDWLRLQPDGVLLNYSLLKKFGITVGKVSIAFQRRDDEVCADLPNAQAWAMAAR
jgi:hypothetical protein